MLQRGALLVALLGATAGASLALPISVSWGVPADSDNVCTYELAAPQLQDLPGGARGVVATLTWTGCTGSALPVYSTACLLTAGTASVCAGGLGWEPARAIFPAQQPTGPIRATGVGCYSTPTQATLVCPTREEGGAASQVGSF